MKPFGKKIFAGFLAAACVTVSGLSGIFHVYADEQTAVTDPVTIHVSVYDALENKPLVPSTQISVGKTGWDQSLLEELKTLSLIDSYTYSHGVLSDLKVSGVSYPAGKTDSDGTTRWISLVGGVRTDLSSHTVKDGETVVWRYAKHSENASSAPSSDVTTDNPVSDVSMPVQESSDTVESSISSVEASSQASSVPESSSRQSSSAAASSKPEAPVNPNRYEWDDHLAQVLDDSCAWLKRNEPGSFQLVALGAAGKSADTKTVDRYMHTISQKNGGYDKATDLELDILSATFSGLNANDIRGINLVNQLANFPDVDKQGVNGAAYALLALDSNDYQIAAGSVNNRNALIDKILQKQKQDGGFSLDGTMDSDVDMTAICLTALAPYREQDNVQQSIQKGLTYLSEVQRSDGQFISYGNPSLESMSQVIVALNSLEISMNDKRFLKGRKNLVELMLEYAQSDGGFASQKGQDSNVFATEQATLALVALKNGMSPYTTNYSSSEPTPAPKESGNVLFYVLIGVFALVLIATAAGFVYFKNKHKKSDDPQPVQEDAPSGEQDASAPSDFNE